MTSSDSLLRTAVSKGISCSMSKSSELIAELSLRRSLNRFFLPLTEGRARKAGRVRNAETRSSARFWRPKES